MLNYLKQEVNKTFTENGAVTHISTMSDCLDLFATIGAIRSASDSEIQNRFARAFAEDKDIAMKLLFFARDIRGGLGERRVFRVIMRWLAQNAAESVRKNLEYVGEYGRFDDLLALMDTSCEKAMLDTLKKQFEKDMKALRNGGNVSLLAKWLPSVNTSNAKAVIYAKKIARHFGMREAEYRKALSALRAKLTIIENHLRERDYTFDYAKQPSKAMYKYRKAFIRNDGERYGDFIASVSHGEVKLHADTLYPYELVGACLNSLGFGRMNRLSKEEVASLNAMWNSLPDFTDGENNLAVVDTSGSMYSCVKPSPASVALSLGLYFAERNTGIYKDHFIEFSARPQLIEIKGDSFVERVRYVTQFNEIANTNLEAVFDLILRTAVKNKVPKEQLPKRLYIISDMEFDSCMENTDMTNFASAKKKFKAKGYDLPEVIFWNVASRNRQQPVTRNEQGVALVSGCTPRLFSMTMDGKLEPYAFMMEVVNRERYADIVA
ncbi:MAG: DUF2828 family protein [Clostridia bacterium]|nr:DUF2828 family protein [Clostridia bacterium]